VGGVCGRGGRRLDGVPPVRAGHAADRDRAGARDDAARAPRGSGLGAGCAGRGREHPAWRRVQPHIAPRRDPERVAPAEPAVGGGGELGGDRPDAARAAGRRLERRDRDDRGGRDSLLLGPHHHRHAGPERPLDRAPRTDAARHARSPPPDHARLPDRALLRPINRPIGLGGLDCAAYRPLSSSLSQSRSGIGRGQRVGEPG